MKPPISREELKRRMMQCGGISPDDAENAAVMELLDEIDRLRGEQRTPPQGKTVRVRFPGMIDGNGEVIINNYHRDRNGGEHHSVSSWPSSTIFWLTATLPVPQEVEVAAEVENEDLVGR